MSFLYDKEVYQGIIGVLEKKAQDAGPIDKIQVAKKLVNRLSRELDNTTEAPNVSSAAPTPAALNTENLQNLGSLLKFLDQNQIKIDGIRLAYDQAESEQLSEGDQNKLSPITINLSRDAATRKWNTADYYTNLDALIKYVKYLQDKAKNENNKVLSVMVGKLIDQVNEIKPESGLSRRPKPIPGQVANEVSDDTIIDGFGSKIFDAKNPTSDRGNIVLHAKDLKNRESLNAWMMAGPEAQITTYDDKGTHTVKYSNENANLCVVINVLFKRAQRWVQISQSAEDTKKYNFFLKKIQEIGPTFTGPDGKSCMISDNVLTSGRGDTTPASYNKQVGSNGDQQSENSSISTENINRIVSTLPLSVRDINFDRIDTFFNLVKSVINNGARGNLINNYIIDTDQRMNVLKSMMLQPDTVYSTNTNPKDFGRGLKDYRNYLPALDRLSEILRNTRQVILQFYAAYENQLDQQSKNLILGQIGRNSTDNSIYFRNLEDLEGLKAGVNQVMRIQ